MRKEDEEEQRKRAYYLRKAAEKLMELGFKMGNKKGSFVHVVRKPNLPKEQD